MTHVSTISLEELRRALQAGTVEHFWNVLTDEYFQGVSIPGSRRVPLDRVGREVAGAGLPKDANIVVYCAGPGCPQSRQAAEKLAKLGYDGVRAFEGGIEAWQEAGLPLEDVRAAQGAA